MRLLLLLALVGGLANFAQAEEETPTAYVSKSTVPLGSQTLATLACGEHEHSEVLFDNLVTTIGHGGYEQVSVACQRALFSEDSPAKLTWITVRITKFSCATAGEKVYPLYAHGQGTVNLICLPTEAPQSVEEKMSAQVRTFPVPLASLRKVRADTTGVRHLRRNHVYSVRCAPGEELSSWREQRENRWYYHVSCLTEEGQKNHERFIACQYPRRLVPQRVVTSYEEDTGHYVCLRPPLLTAIRQ